MKTGTMGVVAVGVVLGMAGCTAGAGTSNDAIAISPDNRTVAYSYVDSIGVVGPGMSGIGTILFSKYVAWAPMDNPGAVRRLRLKGGLSGPGIGGAPRVLAFSPDSRRLAFLGEEGAEVLDLSSGEHRPFCPPGERVDAVAWLSADELAYASATFDGQKSRGWVCRHRIDRPVADRTVVYHDPAGAWQTHFSRDGRRAILAPTQRQALLLDVTAGRVSNLGPASCGGASVAWRPDSSAALCSIERLVVPVGNTSGLYPPAAPGDGPVTTMPAPPGVGGIDDGADILFVQVDPGGGDRIEQVLSLKYPGHCLLEPLWTADGRYAVSSHFGPAGVCALIGPKPWAVIPMTEKLDACLPFARRDISRSLAALPVPGWLVTRATTGALYALDYSAARFLPLSSRPDVALTADGARLVETADGKIAVRPISLPPAERGLAK